MNTFLVASLVLMFEGTYSITINMNSNIQAVLGESDTQLNCSFIANPGDVLFLVSFKVFSGGRFKTVATFSPTNTQAPSYTADGQYLVNRTTLKNPGIDNVAILTFRQIVCEDETDYQCEINYFDGGLGSVPSPLPTASTNITVKVPAEIPNSPPVISTGSDIMEGENVTFTCTGNVGNPPGRFVWEKYRVIGFLPTTYPNEPTVISNSPGTCTYNGTSSLTITVEDEDDNAIFRCMIVQELFTNFQETAAISILYSIRNTRVFRDPDLPVYIEGTQPITLSCIGAGNPSPIYTWYKEGSDEILSNTSILVINDVINKNAGNYTCIAENVINGVFFNETITTPIVVGTYSITINMNNNIQAVLGESDTQLNCSFIANPGDILFLISFKVFSGGQFKTVATFSPTNAQAPSYTADGQYLFNRTTLKNPGLDNVAILTFHEILCEDETDYQCEINYIDSGSGTVPNPLPTASTNITVKVPANIPDSPPVASHESDITEGENVTFTCTGNVGNPAGHFVWEKYRDIGFFPITYPNEPTAISNTPGTCSYNGTSSLTITVEDDDDNAIFRCIIVQELFTSFQQTAPISVLYSIRNTRIFRDPDLPVYIEGTQPITLSCIGAGNPSPIYTWYKEGSVDILSNTSILVINDVINENAGNYTCMAENVINGVFFNESITTPIVLGTYSITINMNDNIQAVLGESDTQLNCSFIANQGDILILISFKVFSGGQFKTVATFSPTNAQAPSYTADGQYLVNRTTLKNPGIDNVAIMTFHEILCEDETDYQCEINYIDSGTGTVPNPLPTASTNITVKVPANIPDSPPVASHESDITEGENVTFTCTGNVGNPAGHFVWEKYREIGFFPTTYPNEPTVISNTPRNCSYNGTSSLTITVEDDDDNAIFRCIIVQELFTNFQQTAPISVLYSIRNTRIFRDPDLPVYIEGSQPITLSCVGAGNPAPIYTWYKKGSVAVLSNTSILVINDVKSENAGNYTCIAENVINGVFFNESISTAIVVETLTTEISETTEPFSTVEPSSYGVTYYTSDPATTNGESTVNDVTTVIEESSTYVNTVVEETSTEASTLLNENSSVFSTSTVGDESTTLYSTSTDVLSTTTNQISTLEDTTDVSSTTTVQISTNADAIDMFSTTFQISTNAFTNTNQISTNADTTDILSTATHQISTHSDTTDVLYTTTRQISTQAYTTESAIRPITTTNVDTTVTKVQSTEAGVMTTIAVDEQTTTSLKTSTSMDETTSIETTSPTTKFMETTTHMATSTTTQESSSSTSVQNEPSTLTPLPVTQQTTKQSTHSFSVQSSATQSSASALSTTPHPSTTAILPSSSDKHSSTITTPTTTNPFGGFGSGCKGTHNIPVLSVFIVLVGLVCRL